jgi:hypothetical protein
MRFMTINRKAVYSLFVGGILAFPAFFPMAAMAQAESPLKAEIPLPYPGYNPDREKAMAECTRQFMPTKGMSPGKIMQSDSFKFTPGIARQIRDCIAKKGYQYNSPTAALADNIPDAEKKLMSREQKEYYGLLTQEDIEGAGLADPQPSKVDAPAATIKPVPMLPMPDAEKPDDAPKQQTDAEVVQEKDVKSVPGAVLPPVNQRQPVFVEPEATSGSSGKPIFLRN